MRMSREQMADRSTGRVHAVNGANHEWRDDHPAAPASNEAKNRSKSAARPSGRQASVTYFNIFAGLAGDFFILGAAFARAEAAAASARRAQGIISWGDSIASSGAVK